MFELLSDDVTRRIYQHLNAQERGRFASLNQSLRRLFKTWDDVQCCSVRSDGLSLAGESYVFEHEPFVSCLKRCPWIRKLAVHDVRVLAEADISLIGYLGNLDELHIPSDLFDSRVPRKQLIESLLSLPKLRILCVQQRYCDDKSHLNIFTADHAIAIKSKNVTHIKLQAVTVSSDALEMLSVKYPQTLQKLCLIGSLMHTHDINVYFNAINRFDNLSALTIPPSLYSISPSNEAFFAAKYPSLQNLQALQTLAVFVSRPDVNELKRFVYAVLPTTLQDLILFDASYQLELSVKDELGSHMPKVSIFHLTIDKIDAKGESCLGKEDVPHLTT
ncbi:unnamed protein product [Anisakis simplex]|uniref:F-box domain-containing protein n=1 Tax=Anisakis simplex TaxID=6269 RepID=A0A0M3K0S0_ANISI|nr:unnamed protein product [Anisakis simplex]